MLDGLDALLSIVQMPPGVPVACVGVDNAKNAAVLAARILARVSDLVELLRGLVEIDSINPDLIPGAAGEAEIARYVAEWSEREGLEAVIEEAAPGRPNVIATARGSGGGRTLLLNAHMDTVGVDTMEAPFDARVEDGRLYGRGCYDMKGSLARRS